MWVSGNCGLQEQARYVGRTLVDSLIDLSQER